MVISYYSRSGAAHTRTRVELVLENAMLRQQLIVLQRQVKRPALRPTHRLLLVLVAAKVRHWKQALLIVQPDTLLRWHRELFKVLWRHKTRRKGGNKPVAQEVVALIRQMARENLLWGAERIRGELLKLGLRTGKGSILKYMHKVRPAKPPRQTWLTFVHNHAGDLWACDFIQTTDVWFRALFVFVIIEQGSRRVVHIGVTCHPTDTWVAQQLREATPFQQAPRFLIRDNDRKYGAHFTAVATGSNITVLKTPIAAPKANAVCERFIGSVRRECLNHMLILNEQHLLRMMKAYCVYFNTARPHQGIQQHIPEVPSTSEVLPTGDRIVSYPVLGGLHHHYTRRAA